MSDALEVCHKMSHHFLLSCCILGFIFYSARAWHVAMPSNIKGMKGSCLVIPCKFNYYQYPPQRPDRVVWYQYVSRGYPSVYDDWYPNDVIAIFKGKTKRYRPNYTYGKDCSLQIYPLDWSHHRQKIYPWVDPENVGRSTYRFFDTTVTIEVMDRAEEPDIMIFGDMKVGQSVTVQCSVYHTCPSDPPKLSVNIPGQHNVVDNSPSDGTFKTTLTAKFNIEREQQTVQCSVRHTGGLTETSSKTFNAKCSISQLTISGTSGEFFEGVAKKIDCIVSYTCLQNTPTLTWNYGSMPASTAFNKHGSAPMEARSTLTFKASANDHGRSLTCYARFSGGERLETSTTLRVKRNMLSRGWSFTTPSSITGMKGSCVIIPCRFTYSETQPADLQVIWFLYQSNGYPPVYGQRQDVISTFRGKTSLTGSVSEGNCSLKIERLETSHNQERLYPWVDKNAITSYHTQDFSFNDKTTQLVVSDHAQEPQLSVISMPRVGEQSTVSCSVRHTCISAPPTLSLIDIPGTDHLIHTLVSDEIWESKVERTWIVTEENQDVKCTVSYQGGQKATTELKLNVVCPFEDIKMDEWQGEATEGLAKSVICSVSYKCKKNLRAIVWNYENMPISSHTEKISSNTFKTISNLTFISSLEDNNKSLICTARFMTEETSDSVTLHIKKYVEPVEEIDPHEKDLLSNLAATVPSRFKALTRSCVVIPCSFQHPEHLPMTRGIWSKKAGGVVYHNGQSNVLDHFKGRTRILGDISEGNCTLEIDDIKPFDNGPFCFHAERRENKYKFNNSCVFIIMKASPEKPAITPVPPEVDAGSTVSVSCSVVHTCPSHPPVFSWSVPHLTSEITQTWTPQSIWETTSTITFMAAGGDGVQSLNCTATFWGGKQQVSTVQLNVKGSLMYQLRKSLPVVIPISLLVLIIITLVAVFGKVIYRKRRQNNDSLRPPPRPEKRRSLWGRISRRSVWSRFSRRVDDDRIGWHAERKPRNKVTAENCNTPINKQHFPSPKDNRRPPRPVKPGVVDYNVYGNI